MTTLEQIKEIERRLDLAHKRLDELSTDVGRVSVIIADLIAKRERLELRRNGEINSLVYHARKHGEVQ